MEILPVQLVVQMHFINSATVQSDGKIIVTGSSSDGTKKVFTTVRYNLTVI